MEKLLSSAQASSQTPSDAWEREREAVFKVNGINGHGTAFSIAKDRFITNWHVVENAGPSLTLVDSKGKVYGLGEEVWADREHDLAMISVAPGYQSPEGATALPLGDSHSLVPGTALRSFGYKGEHLSPVSPDFPAEFVKRTTLRKAMEEGTKDLKLPENHYLAKHPAQDPILEREQIALKSGNGEGASGGPEFDHEKKVVSVVTMSGGGPGMNYNALSTPVEYVKDLADHPERFEHLGGHYGNGFQQLWTARREGTLPYAPAAVLAGAVIGGHKFAQSTLEALSPVTRYGTLGGGALAGTCIAALGYGDIRDAVNSTTMLDRIKFGAAAVADLAMGFGLAAVTANPKLRSIGNVALYGGFAGRLATELVPNYYIIDKPSKH